MQVEAYPTLPCPDNPNAMRAQVRCLEYALANGADVTLNSYGGLNADSSALKTAIGVAEARGQLFVTAAGNDYGVPGLFSRSCVLRIETY